MKYLKKSGIELKTFEYYAAESDHDIARRMLQDQEILKKKAEEERDAVVKRKLEAKKREEESKPDLSDIKVDTPESIKAEMEKEEATS